MEPPCIPHEQTKGVTEMPRFELIEVINRPAEVVYAYMSDPENNLQWQAHCLDTGGLPSERAMSSMKKG